MDVTPKRNRILRWGRGGPLPRRGREAGHCACVEPPRQLPGPTHLCPCSSFPQMSGGRWRNERTLATELRALTAQTRWSLGPSIPASLGASLDEGASAGGPHPKSWHCVGDSHGQPPVPADRHPPGSPTPSQDMALSRGAAPRPPQLPQLHPQQVRGAQEAPGWGSCAPLPLPQNLPDPLTTQSGWPNVQRQVWMPLLQGQRGGAGNPDGLTPQGLRGGPEGRGHCFLQGRELRCPAAKWTQLLCRLKNQPELRDPDPAKSTDTRKSGWEAPPHGSHGSHGSRQPPTQEGSFLSPEPQTLSLGGWMVGMAGVSPAPAIQWGQKLQHHPEPKREPKGSHPPGAEESQGLGLPPERGHTHTRPHVLTLTHTYVHIHSHVYTRAHPLPPTYCPLRPCLSVPRATATNYFPTGPSTTLQGPEDNPPGG